ncbi:LpxI family protein [Celeribacter litoreus]|uniref:LpxI family protein n=1 Tax=Celeribacter litoreus TaxID=2876714 RepID=UPI001CCD7236|nr:UDP-2,3-diacylglucosamine diphosphatase LpxI [Celeribacter litoreus]MCA0043841.1 UDP-2,3-diacylglucosamine diphosphatase LpxI [Celeribacter litoreus]
MTRTAIIAGSGALPQLMAEALPDPLYVTFDDAPVPAGVEHLKARFEKLGRLFKDMKARDVGAVVFAGAVSRPKINPMRLDRHALKLALSMKKGDDGILREVIALFESQGFLVRSATEIHPGLVLAPGTHWGRKVTKEDLEDAARASKILTALSPLDVGQGAVCAGGMILGIETLQGTDAMLRFVAETPERLRRAKGVFVKSPKAGQDMRIDVPTIGLGTIDAVIKAGVGGLVIPPGEVIVLDRDEVKVKVEEAGLFLLAQ